MSAILQPKSRISPVRPFSELEATREISRWASNAVRIDIGLDALAAAVLRVPGIHRIRIEQAPELTGLTQLDWRLHGIADPLGRAVTDISIAGRTWGQVRLFFELHNHRVESPLRFARFIAQQIAFMLERLALAHQRDLLAAQLESLRRRLKTRKAVHRATGILTRTRGISELEAMALLRTHARQSRRSLGFIAEGVIINHADTPLNRPVLRRHRRHIT
jgi:hypothetical protein